MSEIKQAEPNAEPTEEKISPLSLPLDKQDPLADDNEAATAKISPKELKRISQKKFADMILQRVDERIARRGNRRRQRPGLGIILLLLFVAPFFFRAGSDIYDVMKSKLPYYLEFYGLDFLSAPGESSPDSAVADKQIATNLNELLKLQKNLLKKPSQKVVIIYPERAGSFSLKREKKRIFELSGLDIDDPVKGSGIIGKIKSLELLVAMVESFDRIIDNAGKKKKLSSFHLKNAIEGKKMALERIRQIR